MFLRSTCSPLVRALFFQRPSIYTILRLQTDAAPFSRRSIYNSFRSPVNTRTDETWNNLIGDHVKRPEAKVSRVPDEIWSTRSHDAYEELERHPPANAYSGRSVRVIGHNVADAFKKLDIVLARNRVRAQLKLDVRHEKKGAKRRRLSSERWRKQFAHEVRKKVQLVTKIRNRGA